MRNNDTIIVTGASAGIGQATASLLLEHGYPVIGIARDFSKCNLDSSEFTAVELDLSRLDELPARLEAIPATGRQSPAWSAAPGPAALVPWKNSPVNRSAS